MSILNTSLSGMMANTNWLTTISQNVANANTTGYKDVETSFSAMVNASVDFDSEFAGVSSTVRALNSLQGLDHGARPCSELRARTVEETPANSESKSTLALTIAEKLVSTSL